MILERLRAQTAEAHRALEAQVDIEAAISSTDRYRHLLQRFLGFYAPMETHLTRLAGWKETGYDPQAREKAPWLRADLESLGETVASVQALPLCDRLPHVPDLAAGFGCAYVLEGSTLGGRHISRMLGCFPEAERPRRFFTSDGGDVGPAWKQFCRSLEEFAAREDRHEPITQAAVETFTCFHQWLK